MAWKTIEKIAALVGILAFIETCASKLGWLPGYRVVRIPISEITPRAYLFPGQAVRFTPEFQDGVNQTDLSSVKWSFRRDTSKSFTASGYQPTISLPPGDGGLLEVQVEAQLNSEAKPRRGRTSVYVVQDAIKKIEFPQGASIKMNEVSKKITSSDSFKAGIEVFSGNNVWSELKGFFPGNDVLNIPAYVPLGDVGGKVMFRAKGAAQDLSTYGAEPLPSRTTAARPDK